MNSEKTPELTVQTLVALRNETDAVRLITERLKVKEMGPADHIRTKHEVKAFVQSGNEAAAEALLLNSKKRHELGEKLAIRHSITRGSRVSH